MKKCKKCGKQIGYRSKHGVCQKCFYLKCKVCGVKLGMNNQNGLCRKHWHEKYFAEKGIKRKDGTVKIPIKPRKCNNCGKHLRPHNRNRFQLCSGCYTRYYNLKTKCEMCGTKLQNYKFVSGKKVCRDCFDKESYKLKMGRSQSTQKTRLIDEMWQKQKKGARNNGE